MGKLAIFLNNLFSALKSDKISYAICGNYEMLPNSTSHDIDIWTSNIVKFENVLLSVAEKQCFRLYINNPTANGGNYFFFNEENGKIITVHIDIMCETSFIIFPLVKTRFIEGNIMQYKNFFVVIPDVEAAMHLLYPLVVLGKVKTRYKEDILKNVDSSIFKAIITETLGGGIANKIIEMIKISDWSGIEMKYKFYRKHVVINSLKSDYKIRIKICIRYVKTFFHKLTNPSGLFISLIGTDGVGKSTITAALREYVPLCFLNKNETYSFYWRPFLLPKLHDLFNLKMNVDKEILNEDGVQVLNYNSRRTVFYFLKFFYYLMDFNFGTIKYWRSYSTGGLVIFDRYYFDNIVYPERFGFFMKKSIQIFFMKFIPKPDILFYLKGTPKVIIERKNELSENEITNQQYEYEKLLNFSKINSVKINVDDPLQRVTTKIIRNCFYFMANRYYKS